MALASPFMNLEDELKCSICMDYLKDPVNLDCGHDYCRGCISEYCEMWEDVGNLQCPLCKAKIKKGNFRSNWQLANIIEKIKCLSVSLEKEHFCVRHQEKLHLFCKEDRELVCLICERSPEHQSHTLLLLEEAAKECKDELCSCLEDLRKEQEIILANKERTLKESQNLLSRIEEKKTRTEGVFKELYQFLEEQKSVQLSQLEELEKEIVTRREEHMDRLVEKLSSLESLIQQIEEKCQQPARELLQDIRWTLERYEKKEPFDNSVAFSPELTCRTWGLHDEKPILKRVMKQLNEMEYQAKVTLDPDTAQPQLILSEDCKSVQWKDEYQDLPDNPERFDPMPFVLGQEGFTAGKHYWDINVGSEGIWTVGVARKSVKRKHWFDFNPEEGIWVVGKRSHQYIGFSAPDFTPLSFGHVLRRIRVTLDYDEGHVAFSDAYSGADLYTFSQASFCGETILPFFSVYDKAHLTLSP